MPRKKRYEYMTPSQRADALELTKLGFPPREIAEFVGVPRTSIYSLIYYQEPRPTNTGTFTRKRHRGGLGYLTAFLYETGETEIDVSRAMGLRDGWATECMARRAFDVGLEHRMHTLGQYYQEHGRLIDPKLLDELAPLPAKYIAATNSGHRLDVRVERGFLHSIRRWLGLA